MSNILKIAMPEHLDSVKVSKLLLSETPIDIEITNEYAAQIATVTQLSINGLTSDELEALLTVINLLTGTFEIGSYVFSVVKNEKTFSLTDSYFRDAAEIPKPAIEIPDGTTLIARFEIPGFEINSFREIPLYFNVDFDPADLIVLEEIGITLTGNGSEFTVSNETDCKVSFRKPEASEIEYIIDFQMYNEIIPADE